jgi:5-methylthioadenosine/S-adenosylhomocysteine deaminase
LSFCIVRNHFKDFSSITGDVGAPKLFKAYFKKPHLTHEAFFLPKFLYSFRMKLLTNTKYLDDNFNVQSGHILIKENKVIRVEEDLTKLPNDCDITDCHGLIVLPGFVNAHFHSGSNSARGVSQEMGIFEWGNETEQGKVQNVLYDQVDKYLSDDEYEVIVQMGLIELLKQGVTSVIDSGFAQRSLSPVIKAFESVGLRAVIDTYDDFSNLSNSKDSLLRYAAHLSEEEDLSEETIAKSKKLKDECDPLFLSHSMENLERKKIVNDKYGDSSAGVYYKSNLLGRKTVLFHGTFLSKDDIKILSKTGTNLVHCPESNFTTSSGIAPIQDCLRDNVNVCLGTDWANTNYWEGMRLAYQLLKISSGVKEFDAKCVLKMATSNGYKAMSIDENMGVRSGALADFSFISLDSPSIQPLISTKEFDNYCHNIVMNCDERQVVHVMVDGEWVVQSRVIINIDEEEVASKYKLIMTKIFKALV